MQKIGQKIAQKTVEKTVDQETEASLLELSRLEDVLKNRTQGVKFVLVVISARGMAFDIGAMRQKILMAYPDSTIFFQTTMGAPVGHGSPSQVDLLIDLTGPRQREGLFRAKKLRRIARVAVGRNAGLFRMRSYDRIYDEKLHDNELPTELLERERFVQKRVLELAGVATSHAGEALPDLSQSIALDLPSLKRM